LTLSLEPAYRFRWPYCVTMIRSRAGWPCRCHRPDAAVCCGVASQRGVCVIADSSFVAGSDDVTNRIAARPPMTVDGELLYQLLRPVSRPGRYGWHRLRRSSRRDRRDSRRCALHRAPALGRSFRSRCTHNAERAV